MVLDNVDPHDCHRGSPVPMECEIEGAGESDGSQNNNETASLEGDEPPLDLANVLDLESDSALIELLSKFQVGLYDLHFAFKPRVGAIASKLLRDYLEKPTDSRDGLLYLVAFMIFPGLLARLSRNGPLSEDFSG